MVISAILTAMRSAAIAALKAGKVAVKVTAKTAKVTAKAGAKAAKAGAKAGAKAAKATGKAASKAGKQAGKAAKKAGKKVGSKAKDKAREKAEQLAEQYDDEYEELEELEDPAYNRGKRKRKAGVNVLKAGKFILSKGFILAVGLVEDLAVLLLITLLIFGLILLVCIVSVFGTFSGVLSTDTLAVSSTRSSSNSGMTSAKKGGVKITDPSTYDWWGNKDQNMLLLTEDSDKELYQIIACNAELQKYGISDTSSKKLWNIYNGVGLLMSEMGGGMYSKSMGLHDGSKEEIDQIINDKCNYVFAYHTAGGGDGLGDGPIGLTWNLASDKSYDFGPFSVKNVNQTYLKDSITKSGRGYKDNQGYAQWTLPGGLKWCYDNSFEYSLNSTVNSESGETVSNIFDRWGIEKTDENLLSFCVTDYYAKHHGYGDVDRAYVLEYILALYKYADNSLNNISYVDSSGNYSTAFVGNGHGHMMEFLENNVGMSESGSNIQVIHDGKKIVYDYESGNTLAKALLNWAKSNNADGYTHLKAALDWGALYAPDYKAGGNPEAYNFTSYTSNLVACLGVYFSGQTTVNYMVDKLGIVFESEGDSDGTGSNSFSKAATKTQANLKDTMLMHYVKGGVTSSSISDAFLADVEAYKKANPGVKRVGEYTESTNPWLNADWCAATVKGLMKETKLSTSNKTLLEALTEKGKYPDTSSNFADLGIGGVARGSTGEQSTSYAEGYSPYIKVHFTNKNNIRSASTGDIYNFPLVASSPQVASYKSDGQVIVSKESLYTPKTGDVIIYSFDNYGWSHVGMCYDYDNSSNIITTVEGNTGANTSSGAYGYTSHSFNYKDNQSLAWIVEIDYVGLEKACGVSSTSSTTDESGVFKVDSFVKNTVKTGIKSLDSKTKKLIDVSVDGTVCNVVTYEKSGNDKWDVGPVSVTNKEGYVGSKGLASSTSNSYEGSNMTPYGTYYCRQGFGNGSKSSLGINMSTWHDISSGNHYWSGSSGTINSKIGINRYYKGSDGYDLNSGGGLSGGAETISNGKDSYYKYSMLIEYNYSEQKKDGGSAFFLHVSSGKPIAGCVSIPEASMKAIAQWADDNTVICIHKSSEVIERQSSKSK